MPTHEKVRTINTILNLYYVDKITQTEIADRLNLSTAKVNRLLQQARELGYISYVIRTPFQQLFELESRLKAVFGLQEAIVIPSVGGGSNSLMTAIGPVAAKYLLENIRDGDILAITPGTTVEAVINSSDTSRQYQIKIVPMLGAIQGNIESDMNYLAAHLADRLGAKSYMLHAPAYVDTPELAEVVRSMEPVKMILDIARKANVALLGIGTVDPKASRFVEFTALSAEELKHIAVDCGGVGEIAAHVYDVEGRPCAKEYAERVIGLTLEQIHEIPLRIGVSASASKALPIYAALRGGYIHALITDEAAATGVLDLFDKGFRKLP
ncbi:MAG TPA: sugar-binding transcriptional regulator [Patescibacteria group bacterium]|nr:sugar-binding transcriptional regulator [Patescibacteria group bacterium]